MAVYGEKKKPMDATTQYKVLKRLGNTLSGRGAGSADTQAARGANASRNLRVAAATSKGGGQGKSAPVKEMVTRSKRDSSSPKMNPTQKANSFYGSEHVGTWNLSAKKK